MRFVRLVSPLSVGAAAFASYFLSGSPLFCLSFTSGASKVSQSIVPAGGTLAEDKEERSALAKLKSWQSGGSAELDKLNRRNPTDVEASRRVVVAVGGTGSGKSATGNTIAGRQVKNFASSSTLTSVTKSVSFRDYSFMDAEWRIIDTPGLKDTNLSADVIRGELVRLASFAPHGISAFIIVIPRGRFTPEAEQALRDIVELFGEEDFFKHCFVAITHATDSTEGRNLLPRNLLVDEVNALPLDNLLRQLVEKTNYRLVPVENRSDTQRQISRLLLHQRALEVEESNGGRRYDASQLVKRAEAVLAKSASTTDLDRLMKAHTGSHSTAHAFSLGPCQQRFEKRASASSEKLTFVLECDVGMAALPSK